MSVSCLELFLNKLYHFHCYCDNPSTAALLLWVGAYSRVTLSRICLLLHAVLIRV